MSDKKLIPVQGVDTVGIIRDTPAHILPPQAWSDGRNIRFKDGSVHKREGSIQAFATTNNEIVKFAYWPEPFNPRYLEVAAENPTNYTAWVASTAYAVGAIVRTAVGGVNIGYIATSAVTSTVAPNVDTANWALHSVYAFNLIGAGATASGDRTSVPSTTFTSTTNVTNRDWQTTLFTGGHNIIVNNGLDTPLFLNDNRDYPRFNASAFYRVGDRILDGADNNTYQRLVTGSTATAPSADTTNWIRVNNTRFVPIPDWNALTPAGNIAGCKVIRGLGGRLIAGNISFYDEDDRTQTGTMPGTVRVSDIAPVGSIPERWGLGRNSTGADSLADEFEISTTSAIQDIVPLQGQAMIYTNNSIHSLQFDGGGNASVRTVADGYGALNTGTVLEFDGQHLVVGSNDIYTFSGHPGSIKSVSDARVRDYFFDNLNPIDIVSRNLFLLRDEQLDEIHIYFPTINSIGPCDKYLAWNYRNNTWAINDAREVITGDVGPSRGGGIAEGEIAFTSGIGNTVEAATQEVQILSITAPTNESRTGPLREIQELSVNDDGVTSEFDEEIFSVALSNDVQAWSDEVVTLTFPTAFDSGVGGTAAATGTHDGTTATVATSIDSNIGLDLTAVADMATIATTGAVTFAIGDTTTGNAVNATDSVPANAVTLTRSEETLTGLTGAAAFVIPGDAAASQVVSVAGVANAVTVARTNNNATGLTAAGTGAESVTVDSVANAVTVEVEDGNTQAVTPTAVTIDPVATGDYDMAADGVSDALTIRVSNGTALAVSAVTETLLEATTSFAFDLDGIVDAVTVSKVTAAPYTTAGTGSATDIGGSTADITVVNADQFNLSGSGSGAGTFAGGSVAVTGGTVGGGTGTASGPGGGFSTFPIVIDPSGGGVDDRTAVIPTGSYTVGGAGTAFTKRALTQAQLNTLNNNYAGPGTTGTVSWSSCLQVVGGFFDGNANPIDQNAFFDINGANTQLSTVNGIGGGRDIRSAMEDFLAIDPATGYYLFGQGFNYYGAEWALQFIFYDQGLNRIHVLPSLGDTFYGTAGDTFSFTVPTSSSFNYVYTADTANGYTGGTLNVTGGNGLETGNTVNNAAWAVTGITRRRRTFTAADFPTGGTLTLADSTVLSATNLSHTSIGTSQTWTPNFPRFNFEITARAGGFNAGSLTADGATPLGLYPGDYDVRIFDVNRTTFTYTAVFDNARFVTSGSPVLVNGLASAVSNPATSAIVSIATINRQLFDYSYTVDTTSGFINPATDTTNLVVTGGVTDNPVPDAAWSITDISRRAYDFTIDATGYVANFSGGTLTAATGVVTQNRDPNVSLTLSGVSRLVYNYAVNYATGYRAIAGTTTTVTGGNNALVQNPSALITWEIMDFEQDFVTYTLTNGTATSFPLVSLTIGTEVETASPLAVNGTLEIIFYESPTLRTWTVSLGTATSYAIDFNSTVLADIATTVLANNVSGTIAAQTIAGVVNAIGDDAVTAFATGSTLEIFLSRPLAEVQATTIPSIDVTIVANNGSNTAPTVTRTAAGTPTTWPWSVTGTNGFTGSYTATLGASAATTLAGLANSIITVANARGLTVADWSLSVVPDEFDHSVVHIDTNASTDLVLAFTALVEAHVSGSTPDGIDVTPRFDLGLAVSGGGAIGSSLRLVSPEGLVVYDHTLGSAETIANVVAALITTVNSNTALAWRFVSNTTTTGQITIEAIADLPGIVNNSWQVVYTEGTNPGATAINFEFSGVTRVGTASIGPITITSPVNGHAVAFDLTSYSNVTSSDRDTFIDASHVATDVAATLQANRQNFGIASAVRSGSSITITYQQSDFVPTAEYAVQRGFTVRDVPIHQKSFIINDLLVDPSGLLNYATTGTYFDPVTDAEITTANTTRGHPAILRTTVIVDINSQITEIQFSNSGSSPAQMVTDLFAILSVAYREEVIVVPPEAAATSLTIQSRNFGETGLSIAIRFDSQTRQDNLDSFLRNNAPAASPDFLSAVNDPLRPWPADEFNLAQNYVVLAGRGDLIPDPDTEGSFIRAQDRIETLGFGYTFGRDAATGVVGDSYESYVERIHNPIDGEVEHTKSAEFVQLLLSDADVQVQLGMTDSPGNVTDLYLDEDGGTVVPRVFSYNEDYKVDFRRHGRLFNVRISDVANTEYAAGWRLSAYGLSVGIEERRGRRS